MGMSLGQDNTLGQRKQNEATSSHRRAMGSSGSGLAAAWPLQAQFPRHLQSASAPVPQVRTTGHSLPDPHRKVAPEDTVRRAVPSPAWPQRPTLLPRRGSKLFHFTCRISPGALCVCLQWSGTPRPVLSLSLKNLDS